MSKLTIISLTGKIAHFNLELRHKKSIQLRMLFLAKSNAKGNLQHQSLNYNKLVLSEHLQRLQHH